MLGKSIQTTAERVPTPQFFPPKEETPVLQELSNTPSKASSRKSSVAGTKKKTSINSPSAKKSMDKFNLDIGLKDKKKPSTMRKFINMCTGK